MRLRDYRATIEVEKRIMQYVLNEELRLHAIIVRKDVYRKWAKSE